MEELAARCRSDHVTIGDTGADPARRRSICAPQVAEAARQLGVTASTAYQWMKGAAERAEQPRGRGRRAAGPPTFVQVVRAGDLAATIAVRVGNAEVQVRRGFDADLLRAVVEALRGDGT